MRPFLGLYNVYRRFVFNISRFTSPMNKKLEKKDPLKQELGDAERMIEDVLKIKLTTLPVLALQRLNGKYTINTDVCDTKSGVCYYQGRMISFWSPSAIDSAHHLMRRRGMILLTRSAFLSLLHCSPCVPITIISFCNKDESSGSTLGTRKEEINPRLVRWWLRLGKFDYEVVHQSGRYH